MIYLLVPLVLVIIEGIFNASETGLLSIERIVVQLARYKKKPWAIRVNNFLASPERFFSTILICENLIIVTASSLLAKFFIDNFGKNSTIISTVILALYSLIVGQFIPKSIALSNPEKTIMYLSKPIDIIAKVVYPFVYLFSLIASGIARIFQEKPTNIIRRSDIVYAMSEYEKEASRLGSRLFEFSKRKVVDVMIPSDRVFLCAKGAELDTIKKRKGMIYTRIPVYSDNPENIVGIFNIKDYFYTKEVKLRPPYTVDKEKRCSAIFLTMKEKGEHMAIVCEQNRPIGIVTLEDLIEELVGEIKDEA